LGYHLMSGSNDRKVSEPLLAHAEAVSLLHDLRDLIIGSFNLLIRPLLAFRLGIFILTKSFAEEVGELHLRSQFLPELLDDRSFEKVIS